MCARDVEKVSRCNALELQSFRELVEFRVLGFRAGTTGAEIGNSMALGGEIFI